MELRKLNRRPPSGQISKVPMLHDMQIGQIHINRLKKFYCDNLDKKNTILQNQMQGGKEIDTFNIDQNVCKGPPNFPP